MSTREHYYFAADGNYDNAQELVTIETTDWSADVWTYLDMLGEEEKYQAVKMVSEKRGSFDQQDCPACGWTGQPVREFLDPERGDAGGYEWE
jgi:chitodextrinase